MNQSIPGEDVLAELERLCQEILRAQEEFLASIHELTLPQVLGATALTAA